MSLSARLINGHPDIEHPAFVVAEPENGSAQTESEITVIACLLILDPNHRGLGGDVYAMDTGRRYEVSMEYGLYFPPIDQRTNYRYQIVGF